MPLLELGDISTPGGSYRAQIAVRSVMTWPTDVEARRHYLASVMARHLGELEHSENDLPDPAQAGSWFEAMAAIEEWESWYQAKAQVSRWFHEGGGFVAVSAASSLSDSQQLMMERVGAWFAAGLILAFVRRMAAHHADFPGGASVNKAVFVLERARLLMIPRNSNDLRRAWTTYKPVAHFCAALFDTFIECIETGGGPDRVGADMERKLTEDFAGFLATADAYQQFGLAYAPLRAKAQPILDHAGAWLLPDETQWEPTPYVPAPFDARLLEIARSYRAPVPID